MDLPVRTATTGRALWRAGCLAFAVDQAVAVVTCVVADWQYDVWWLEVSAFVLVLTLVQGCLMMTVGRAREGAAVVAGALLSGLTSCVWLLILIVLVTGS